MMEVVKLVITGPYSAGKSSFIRAVSEIEVVNTDYETTLADERAQKAKTTVALDFGIISVNEDVVLHLYGTPGQERFAFMWQHLTIGCLGYIVLVDSSRPEHFPEARTLMQRFAELSDAPLVVAANKQDHPDAMTSAQVRRLLQVPDEIDVLPCVGTDRESVKNVLLTLLDCVAQRLPDEDYDTARQPA